jgi:hypothetical protein
VRCLASCRRHRPGRGDGQAGAGHRAGHVSAESARLPGYRRAAGGRRQQSRGRSPRVVRGRRDDGVAAVVFRAGPGRAPLRVHPGPAGRVARRRGCYRHTNTCAI